MQTDVYLHENVKYKVLELNTYTNIYIFFGLH